MVAWKPYWEFAVPYLLATAAAVCMLWAQGKPYTLRELIGKAGRGGLLGGSIAPILGLVPVEKWLAVEVEAAIKTRAWAVLLGGGYVRSVDIRSAILRALGKSDGPS